MENNNMELLWQYIELHSASFSKYFYDHIPELTRLLVLSLLEEGEITTGIAVSGKKQWSFITFDPYNTDAELSLRFHGKNVFDLYFQYYDDDKEKFVEVSHIYSQLEIDGLPDGLKSILNTTLESETSQHINSKQL